MRPTSHYQLRRVKSLRKINASAETWRKMSDPQHVHSIEFHWFRLCFQTLDVWKQANSESQIEQTPVFCQRLCEWKNKWKKKTSQVYPWQTCGCSGGISMPDVILSATVQAFKLPGKTRSHAFCTKVKCHAQVAPIQHEGQPRTWASIQHKLMFSFSLSPLPS